MRKPIQAAAILAALLLSAGTASAGLVDAGAGGLTTLLVGPDWEIDGTDNPLTVPIDPILLFKPPPVGWPAPTLTWRNNNWSPVPYSDPFVPSPGQWNYDVAERFDLEGLFFDYSDAISDNLNVYLVTSIAPTGTLYGGVHYRLGDVFLDVDGALEGQPYEYALLSFDNATVYDDLLAGTSWDGTGRDAGALVALSGTSTLYGVNGPASYAGDPSGFGLNPWALSNVTVTADHNLLYEKISANVSGPDGIDEYDEVAGGPVAYALADAIHDTYVYRWEVTLPQSLEIEDFTFHVTVQCGNDIIDGGDRIGAPPPIPVPSALVIGALGVCLVTVYRRMRG